MENLYNTAEAAWTRCLDMIKQEVSFQSFKTWFEPIRPVTLEESVLTLQVPNQFFYEWIEEHYYRIIRKATVTTLGEKGAIRYFTDEVSLQPASERAVKPMLNRSSNLQSQNIVSQNSVKQSSSHVSNYPETRSANLLQPLFEMSVPEQTPDEVEGMLNPRYTFENFVCGSNNELAYASAKAVADNPGGTRFNPLVIYGGVGLGKTHLAQAIGRQILSQKSNGLVNKKIIYSSSEKFGIDFINSIQFNKTQEFAAYYRNADVLIVDDIQFLAGKERTQDNFFHLFNTLHQLNKQIVLTSDVPPKQLRGLDERLISRFQWGLTVDIQAPDLETRVAILNKISQEEGHQIDGEILYMIAQNITSSVRELEGTLIRLLAACSLQKRALTMELAKEVIQGIGAMPKRNISIEDVQNAVCKNLGVSITLLTGQTRKQEVVFARQVAMFLIRDVTSSSLKTIGNHFGGRDHTTVMHALSAIAELKKTEVRVQQTLETIMRELGAL